MMNYPVLRKFGPVLMATSAMVLSACNLNSDDEVSIETRPDSTPDPAQFVAGTHPRFNPATSDLPFNTDLIFAAAADSDGTAQAGAPDNPVIEALNRLDGFSPTAYFDILFEGSINPASALPMQTVFLVALDTGDNDALDPANIVGVDLENMPAFTVTVESLDGGENNVLRIRPQQPLRDKSKYLVFVTNDLLDTEGQPVTRSYSYNFIRDDFTNISGQLESVRNAINGWETIAAGVLAQGSTDPQVVAGAREKIVLSYTFTTTDPDAPLVGMASTRAALASQQIEMGASPQEAIANVNQLDQLGLLPRPVSRDLAISPASGMDLSMLTQGALSAGQAKLYTGHISLPSYSPVSSPAPDASVAEKFGFLSGNWQPNQQLAGALGIDLPTDVDGSYNVTYRYPFAVAQTTETLPLQVTLPEPDVTPSFGEGATCAQIQAAQGNPGYPVVLYIHGITSDRSSVMALAHSLAGACVATAAIDLPLHGVAANNPLSAALNIQRGQVSQLYQGEQGPLARERHFEVVQNAQGQPAPMNFESPGEADGSGAWFINLGHLPASRDNLRQAVMDLLNLNASLGNVNAVLESGGFGEDDVPPPQLDLDNMHVVGISLGGIIGTTFVTVNEMARANDAQLQLTTPLNPVQGLVLSTAGSQITRVLTSSDSFAPRINAGLAAAGVNVGTSNYERFMYAAQSTIASGDPVNFAARLADMDVPVLVQQIVGGGNVGDGGNYTADKVVPNAVAGSPLAGTTGLAGLLSAAQTGPGAVNVNAGNALINLTIGHHASLLRPNESSGQAPLQGELLATGELQTQVVSFVLSNTAQTAVGSAPDGSNQAANFIQAP